MAPIRAFTSRVHCCTSAACVRTSENNAAPWAAVSFSASPACVADSWTASPLGNSNRSFEMSKVRVCTPVASFSRYASCPPMNSGEV
eukprot:2687459-Rhodomonas_salina.1